jgi:uncharacterized protein YjbJ (UPF0337 family)
MTTGVWDQLAGQWKQLRGKVREQWGSLTDDDLEMIAGKIQERYGIVKSEAQRQVDEWERELEL